MRKVLCAVFTLLLVVSFGTVAFAQGNGALTGTITDPTGAVVSNASVKATNAATNVSFDTQTSDAGLYRFPTLPVSVYTLSVEAPGFKSSKIENVVITVAQIVTQDIKLEVGAPTETVLVQSSGEQLTQPSESSVSTLLNRNVWETYPLENRDTNEFINLLPGAVPDEFAGSTRGAAVNGIRGGTGNFLVEGFDNNDQGQGGRGALVAGGITSISPEAIEEYRVVTNNYAAQYGKGGGFVTDTVLRSGKNELHGSLFEYNRIQKFAANDFFSNRDGVRDSLVRNQFGGSFGGPIIKDRAFGFGSIEIQRLRQGAPLTTVSTTQQFLDFVSSGNFARFHESDPNGLCVIANGAPCPGAFARSSRLGPAFNTLRAAQSFPLATSGLTNEAAGLFTSGLLDSPIIYPVPVYGDATVVNPSFLNLSRFTFKGDHTMSDTNRLTGTFLLEDSDNGSQFDGGDGTIGAPFISPGRSILTGLTFTHTFSPTVINEAKASYLRHVRDFAQCPGSEGLPSVVTGFDPMGVSLGCSSSLPQFFTDNQFQLQNHLSIVRGNHSFRTGVEYRRIRNGSSFEAQRNGLFLPHGVEELLTDGFFGDEADLALFGAPEFGAFLQAAATVDPRTGTLPEFYRGYRSNEWAVYGQDDWKVTSKLTLNLGLRWEYFGPPHNFRPGFDSNFYFGAADTPVATASANPFFPRNSELAAKVSRGSFQQRDTGIWKKDFNNFAPRVGFAWDVFGTQKLILRGGGGFFYDRIWNNLFENIRFNPPTFSFNTINTPVIGGATIIGPLSSPGLYTVPFTAANTALFNSPAFQGLPAPRHMDENLSIPYVQQFFLGTQYEFAKDFVLEVNYITTQGKGLTGVIDINTFPGRANGGGGRNNGGSARPNTSIGADNFRTNAFGSYYHGGQIGVRNRTWNGVQFNAHYTFSKAIDELSDAFNTDLRHGNFRPQNPYIINLDRARADFDITHRFVSGFTYEAPWFKGNRWLSGWVATGIVQLQSGVPFTIYHGGQDPNADGFLNDRAVFIGTGSLQSVITNNHSPADDYFDTTQFVGMVTRAQQVGAANACGAGNGVVISNTRWWCDGTLGRNALSGPGFANVDFGIHKKFRVTENSALQLQANAFNLFNRPNFDLPVGNINSSNFGRSIKTTGTPRVIQLAIRFDF